MTKHIPKISIIVPVYNAEQYLEWLYGALNKENAKLAVCKFAQIDETAEPTFELFWESPKIERDCYKAKLCLRWCNNVQSVLESTLS